jgi:hypothetical protein
MCTTGDRCAAGACVPGATSLDCNDSDACTADACNSATGCTHTNTAGATCCTNSLCGWGKSGPAGGACFCDVGCRGRGDCCANVCAPGVCLGELLYGLLVCN